MKYTVETLEQARDLVRKTIIDSPGKYDKFLIVQDGTHTNGHVIRKSTKGIPKPVWTEADSKLIEELFNEGKSDRTIAQIMGRATVTIAAHRKQLGLSRTKEQSDTLRAAAAGAISWTEQDLETLRNELKAGRTYREIGVTLGRSYRGVLQKAEALVKKGDDRYVPSYKRP